MHNLLLYRYNDMVSLLIRGLQIYSGERFFSVVNLDSSLDYIDPLNIKIILLVFRFLPPIFAANVLAIFALIINLLNLLQISQMFW